MSQLTPELKAQIIAATEDDGSVDNANPNISGEAVTSEKENFVTLNQFEGLRKEVQVTKAAIDASTAETRETKQGIEYNHGGIRFYCYTGWLCDHQCTCGG